MANDIGPRVTCLPTRFLDRVSPKLRGVVGSLFVEAVVSGCTSAEAVYDHVAAAIVERSVWVGETIKWRRQDGLDGQSVDCYPEEGGNIFPLLLEYRDEALGYAAWLAIMPPEWLRRMRRDGTKIRARLWPSDRPVSGLVEDHLRMIGLAPEGLTELDAHWCLAAIREVTS